MIAATETTMVSHKRSPMTSDTGRPYSSAIPKLPRSTMVIQRRYWTYIGWSSPYWRRRLSASSAETPLPEEDIWAMYDVM